MYRSGFDPTKKNAAETLTNFLGLDSLNMKYFRDMYLDSCSSMSVGSTPSPSISPTSSNGAAETGSLLSPVSMLRPAYHLVNATTSTNSEVAMTIDDLTAMQHQQLLSMHQQQLATAALAKRQSAMAAAAGNNHYNINLAGPPSTQNGSQQDEISKSLKMFAMLTAYSNGTEPPTAFTPHLAPSSVEAVMQDFACNGYVCDDSNRLQLGLHLSSNFANGNDYSVNYQNGSNGAHQTGKATSSNINSATANTTANQQHVNSCQLQHFNMHFNSNFWKMLPTHVQQHSNAFTTAAAAAATTAAAVNIGYNYNQKKLTKRYNSVKTEKYTSTKHCVFCENNNEPEAVVKSHAVRDSLGRVLCPKLRTYTCPICKASGDMAHTVKYCPQKPIITMEDAIKAESLRLAKGTFYKQQMKV